MGPRVVLDDLPAIHAFCLEEYMRLLRYVGSLDDATLSQILAISADRAVRRRLVLAHVVNQWMQHRSEVARYLTECGHSPGILTSWMRWY